ncbi:Gp10 [Mycolicibacterium canariasense]|uniref:Gp10 n=1 Tax=Mycolicibacterium canariasense TaxID=228230 RepID=A0A100WIN8_MYCCR|nr:major capsid protein [Mycolicibacterium canariasense]GAS98806.1 Gp10 [Mycolicibacterium canariasense]
MKFTRPDQLPETAAELTALAEQAKAEINVFQARRSAGEFTLTGDETPEQKAQIKADIERLEYLTANFSEINGLATAAEAEEKGAAERLDAALAAAEAATKPKPAPEPEAPAKPAEEAPAEVPAEAVAEVVAEAEQATAEAAAPAAVTAAAPAAPVSFKGAAPAGDTPKPEVDEKVRKPFLLASTAPNFAQHDGKPVDTSVIAAGIANGQGEFTGLRDGVPTVLATMQRPEGKVYETHDEFLAELDRVTAEINGGKFAGQAADAKALVAAGGWCAPSEQQYGFDPTQPAVGLLSFPGMSLPRGGIIIPSEPDFTSLQTGFHFTEAQLEAVDGGGQPTAIKTIVEVPCPPEMTEYRLEAIGWGVKAGILQKRAWPELIKKFLDEFLVAHQQRISAKSLIKVLALSSAAKVVPTDAVLGATGSILNGLHQRARNIQIRTRKTTIGGIAPIWFRDVLRADLANRDGLDGLDVTDADVDRWLASRDIYLQYEGTWQSLTARQPGHYDTSWWPGSVDVVLFPAGAFWRALDNVLTVGAMYDIDMLTKNRQLLGFVEDEFQVGIRPSDVGSSHLIRVPLCVNGAVGARESIDCSGPYADTVTKTVTTTGGPTGGNFTLKFSANGTPSGTIAYNASAATVDTTLTAIDDNVTAAGDIVTAGGALPTAVTVTYPARLGDLQVGTNGLTGGTSPTVVVS